MNRIPIFLILIFLVYGCKNQGSNPRNSITENEFKPLEGGSIEVLDPRLEDILSKNARIEVLADGHDWTEGPLWVDSQQMLLYSDIPRNAIYAWKEGEGSKLFLQPSGFMGENFTGEEPGSNGLLLDQNGKLVLCQHGERRIAMMNGRIKNPVPSFVSLADRFDGKRFNSPNDAVFKSNGDLYFTDPPYGLPQNMEDPDKELGFQGVYRLDQKGKVTLLTDELTRPNGIAFSPDEKTLYVANSDPDLAVWKAYDVNDDGSIGNERIFFDATDRVPDNPGLPDGMKVDQQGIIYAAGPGGILIFDPAGDLLGIIHTGQATANCTFNADQTELFITADMYLLRVALK